MGGKGSGGHGKKSQKMHLLQGTYRKDRHGPKNEEKGPGLVEQMWADRGQEAQGATSGKEYKAPKPPKELKKAGRELWARITTEFDFSEAPIGLLFLEQTCYLRDRLEEVKEILLKDGPVLTSPRGNKYAHPAIRMESQYSKLYLAYYKALGLPDD